MPVHTWEIETPAQIATCTDEGAEPVLKCAVCGETTGGGVVPALGHDFGDWIVVQEATCAATGKRTSTCARCGYQEEQELPKTQDHAFVEIIAVKEPTCTEEGYAAVEQCAVCGKMVGGENIPALGHDLAAWTVKIPATCAQDGVICRLCRRCHESAIEMSVGKAVNHTDEQGNSIQLYGNTITAPTCTEPGVRETFYDQCPTCGKEISNRLAPLGHDFYDADTVPASEEEDGSVIWCCSRCDETKVQVIPAFRTVLTLPDDLTAIEAEAFSGTAIRGVLLPDGLISIGSRAFAECDDLLVVYMPQNAEIEIADDAFEGNEDVLFLSKGAAFPQKDDDARFQVITVEGGLNLRKGPDTSYARIYIIPQYAYVIMLEWQQEWSYVRYEGHEGYVMSKYLAQR